VNALATKKPFCAAAAGRVCQVVEKFSASSSSMMM
jgi:hypothetical protein